MLMKLVAQQQQSKNNKHDNSKSYCTRNQNIKVRDETIRSSHDTIRIDTKGDDMVIFDTIRYG